MGWLPDLTSCVHCGQFFAGQPGYFHPQHDGLFCQIHRPGGSRILGVESQIMAGRILRTPIPALDGEEWPRQRSADLRRFAVQALERHIDRRLISASAWERFKDVPIAGPSSGQSRDHRNGG